MSPTIVRLKEKQRRTQDLDAVQVDMSFLGGLGVLHRAGEGIRRRVHRVNRPKEMRQILVDAYLDLQPAARDHID